MAGRDRGLHARTLGHSRTNETKTPVTSTAVKVKMTSVSSVGAVRLSEADALGMLTDGPMPRIPGYPHPKGWGGAALPDIAWEVMDALDQGACTLGFCLCRRSREALHRCLTKEAVPGGWL